MKIVYILPISMVITASSKSFPRALPWADVLLALQAVSITSAAKVSQSHTLTPKVSKAKQSKKKQITSEAMLNPTHPHAQVSEANKNKNTATASKGVVP